MENELTNSLRDTRRDLEEAQRIAQLGSWTLDPVTGAATWSVQMFRILGLDPDGSALDLPDISRVFTPESVADVGAAIERARTTGEPWHLDLAFVRPDGTRGTVESRGVVERDAAGTVVRIRGTMQDVTEQRALEAQLHQVQRLEAVGQLAGGIAHDFNNLLTAIRGYATLAAADERGNPTDTQADLRQIVAACDRAADLVRQLLAFSRRQVLQPRVVDAAEIVERLTPLLRRLLGEHIDLRTRHATDVGAIRVDPSQFEQVIVNLAVNARDAMPEGGVLTIETMHVDLDEAYLATHLDAEPGPYVALVVSDTGTGMDEATMTRIFEPFFTTKGASTGTGMGLATVYGIVKQSAGSIYVYSEPGRGTSFKIYLPRVAGGPVAAEAPAGESPNRVPAAGGETILLVEDEPAVRDVARRILAGHGYHVLEVSDGDRALALAATAAEPIHLLITDVTMPGIQGRELAARLTGSARALPVLFVSGFADVSGIEPRPGQVAFLAKPFSAEALLAAVRDLLDRPGHP